MKQQLMERYMSAVADLGKKFENYVDSDALVEDYKKVANEVANRTEMLAKDLGISDVCACTNKALDILDKAFKENARRTDAIRFERQTDAAIDFINNLLK
jgi:CO dehydrogenase nickel-insertion accessory protein CooC1